MFQSARSTGDGIALVLIVLVVACLAVWLVLFFDATRYSSPLLPAGFSVPAAGSGIPRVVVQTWASEAGVPPYVAEQFAVLAPGFERKVFSDEAAAEYVASRYPSRVAEAYRRLEGAHRADLFRYCYLFLEGGVYLDIKTVLVAPLEQVVSELEQRGARLATCVTVPRVLFPCASQVYQGVLIAAPGEPLFADCIEYIVDYWWRTRLEYFALIRNITLRLERLHGALRPGTVPGGSVYFYEERWSYFSCGKGGLMQRSRKTLNCSEIRDCGRVLFGTRFAEFPWSSPA